MSISCDSQYAVYNENRQTARKEHRCSACSEPILKGQPYTYVTGISEGDVRTYKRCTRCQTAHLHLRALCKKSGENDLWPAERLDCGLNYEEEWGEMPLEVQELAFLKPGEQPGTLLK